jgi:hypothetical protein
MNTMKPINALGVLIAALAVAAFVDPAQADREDQRLRHVKNA